MLQNISINVECGTLTDEWPVKVQRLQTKEHYFDVHPIFRLRSLLYTEHTKTQKQKIPIRKQKLFFRFSVPYAKYQVDSDINGRVVQRQLKWTP